MKLPVNLKSVLILIGGAAVLTGIYLTQVNPKSAKQEALRADVAEAEAAVEVLNKRIANLRQGGDDALGAAVKQIADADQVMPYDEPKGDKIRTDLIQRLPLRARELQVSIGALEPGQAVDAPVPGLRYVPMKLSITGAGEPMSTFILSLHSLEGMLLTLGDFDIARSEETAIYTISVDVRAWFSTTKPIELGLPTIPGAEDPAGPDVDPDAPTTTAPSTPSTTAAAPTSTEGSAPSTTEAPAPTTTATNGPAPTVPGRPTTPTPTAPSGTFPPATVLPQRA